MTSLLAVDDEEHFLLLLERTLSKEGYQVQTAKNAPQALELIDRNIFDLAILDIRIYPMDGLELLREIRKRSPDTRVIISTGYPTADLHEKSIELGASGYLVKPFEMSELKAMIHHLTAE